MEPSSFQFIVDELVARKGLVVHCAKHRYGCRIIQQLLRHARSSQLAPVVETLLSDIKALACHVFGNYVVQCLLELGTASQRQEVVNFIRQNIADLCQSISGGAVISSAMMHAAEEDKAWLARAVSRDPEVLLSLTLSKHGHSAVVLVLQVLDEQELQTAHTTLLKHVEAFEASTPRLTGLESFLLDGGINGPDAGGPGLSHRRCGA